LYASGQFSQMISREELGKKKSSSKFSSCYLSSTRTLLNAPTEWNNCKSLRPKL
jgi:hypothetical protein